MRATKAIHGSGRGKRKYTVIAKVKDCNENCGFKFVKYRSNNEQRIINFLKQKFEAVYWANFYGNRGENTNRLMVTYGSKKGFQQAY